MTTTRWTSLAAFAAGCAVTVVGIGLYESWWTAAFAIGGAVVGVIGPRLTAAERPVAIGIAASGAALAGGISAFLLFGSAIGGGAAWFLAGVGSIAGAIVLGTVARRLLRASPRDIPRA
jgi:hypothetical protein